MRAAGRGGSPSLRAWHHRVQPCRPPADAAPRAARGGRRRTRPSVGSRTARDLPPTATGSARPRPSRRATCPVEGGQLVGPEHTAPLAGVIRRADRRVGARRDRTANHRHTRVPPRPRVCTPLLAAGSRADAAPPPLKETKALFCSGGPRREKTTTWGPDLPPRRSPRVQTRTGGRARGRLGRAVLAPSPPRRAQPGDRQRAREGRAAALRAVRLCAGSGAGKRPRPS
mmetsp:Transcript_39763/g.98283  ORF Transcript_39763/g.98283 Transcript_39763/m.98283 type:complete len:228 (+) Transcript_39763:7519-8202(+)